MFENIIENILIIIGALQDTYLFYANKPLFIFLLWLTLSVCFSFILILSSVSSPIRIKFKQYLLAVLLLAALCTSQFISLANQKLEYEINAHPGCLVRHPYKGSQDSAEIQLWLEANLKRLFPVNFKDYTKALDTACPLFTKHGYKQFVETVYETGYIHHLKESFLMVDVSVENVALTAVEGNGEILYFLVSANMNVQSPSHYNLIPLKVVVVLKRDTNSGGYLIEQINFLNQVWPGR